MSRLVLIEYTKDVTIKNDDGEDVVKREKGSRLRVDAKSADSLVDKKKVAKRVDDDRPAPAVAPPPGPPQPGDAA